MTKLPLRHPLPDESGYTLIEVILAASIGGFLFIVLMSLLGQSTNFATYFHGAASSIEASSDAISQLNAIMPQVVKVRSCACSGAASANLSSCMWNEPSGSDPNIGKDPVQNHGVSDGGVGGAGLEIFKGDFEWFAGNVPATGYANLLGLLRSNINGGSAGSLGACQPLNGFSVNGTPTSTFAKGCKLQIRLIYNAPIKEVGTTYSYPGALKVYIGNQNSAATNPREGSWIGQTDPRGSSPLGVTMLSCGFVQSGVAGGTQSSGQLFALNIKIKSRASSENRVASNAYESWHKDGQNYFRGTIRDIRLKYAFRNISSRGVYQWRAQGKRNCIVNGATATNKSDCCSLAISGSSCIACKPAGASGSANECCSEKLTATSVCQ